MPIRRSRPIPAGVPGIKKDGPERYLVCVTWNDPKTGRRRKREAVAATLAEAVELKEQLKQTAPTVTPTRQRFVDYVERWMELHGDELAPSTRARYTQSLAHAVVTLGEVYVEVDPIFQTTG